MVKFEVGKTYKRKEELHGVYGGQQQGGISTPSGQDFVMLFTGEGGELYGYEDRHRPDGIFLYTGEGQSGDMEMVRGNQAIRDHKKDGKRLEIFEYVKKAHVRYVGEAVCVGHHNEQRPDKDGKQRSAIVFHLSIQTPSDDEMRRPRGWTDHDVQPKMKMSLDELRALALLAAPADSSSEVVEKNTYVRSEAVRLYALKRANGICEACRSPAPFNSKDGTPFLEVHHVHRLSDGGPDHPEYVVALCPNCHRRVHCGKDGEALNGELIAYLKVIESK